MLTITKLKGAEYLIASVANGMEDYYMAAGEAPGVWRGSWAADLGLEGVVTAEALRALVDGLDPNTGVNLLAGHRDRKVRAVDVTLSVPKPVSVLWAFGTEQTATIVSIAVVEATDTALRFLEERAAFTRVQDGGVRRRVGTGGFAIATFSHRTSRAGDPQLHVHCLIPNIVQRADGEHVAFDANPAHVWSKATGTVFLNELERLLSERLGVAWGPERNGIRNIVGFTRAQLRAFSKRTTAIETRLEAAGEVVFDSKRARMRADDRASLDTRPQKDKALTPERLRDRWAAEAAAVGLEPGVGVDDLVVGRQLAIEPAPTEREVFAALVDPVTGLCATESRFCEAHVVERVAAMSGGRLTVDEVVDVSRRFLATELVVRLAPDVARRRPPEWSTVEHRAVEDRLLGRLHDLCASAGDGINPAIVDAAIAAAPKRLGPDQTDAVRVLCGAGPSVRQLTAPAGTGKTTAVSIAAMAQTDAGRSLLALAPTHKAVAELRAAGIDAQTIARFLVQLEDRPIGPDTTVLVDEVSQVSTRDAAALLEAAARGTGIQLWFVGDARQGQSVAAGGLALELERLGADGTIPAAKLSENRRQKNPADRKALAKLRAGEVDASRAIRTEHGWEHALDSPVETRQALAEAAVADADRHGVEQVAVLAVSHADCEDVADRIRTVRAARGELRGPSLEGPGWGPELRRYAAGDRILVHANLGTGSDKRVFNGSTGTVLSVGTDGAQVLLDCDRPVFLDAAFIRGCRPDGNPNLSHAWARTVAGSQAGTWAQVHLLGTPALTAFTGYVGQSRGQHPTHTWHARPKADHPARLLADQRSAADAVTDAMRRAEPKTMAASDDPYVIDRRLRAERQEHSAVAVTRPRDCREELQGVRDTLPRIVEEHDRATRSLAEAERARARLGPLRKLRRGGRDDIAEAEQLLAHAYRRLDRADRQLAEAGDHIERCEEAVAARTAWDSEHVWRLKRMAEIDATLSHHWADVTLRAVRADDPLAFGIERLRDARVAYRSDLERINAALPEDRRDALARAERDLLHHQDNLRFAERAVSRCRSVLGTASERHWGRRDKSAIAFARAELVAAETSRLRVSDNVLVCQRRVDQEQRAVDKWTNAVAASADDRARLTAAVGDIDGALDRMRPARVTAAMLDVASQLWVALRPPPATEGGLAAWCGIAELVEAWNDHHGTPDLQLHASIGGRSHPVLGPRPPNGSREWDELASLVAKSSAVVDAASHLDPTPARRAIDDRCTWRAAVQAADRVLTIEQPVQAIDHSLGMEL